MKTPLPRRILGRSGLSVPVIGFGGAPLGDLYAKLDEADAVETVVAAVSACIDYLDTSPLYGHGLSEHRIGSALRRLGPVNVALSTKVGRVTDPFSERGDGSGYFGGSPHGVRYDYSYDGAMRSLEQSLLRLGRDHVDIVFVHDLDVAKHGSDADARFDEAIKGAVKALESLRDQKVIKGYGAGVNEVAVAERFIKACDADAMLLAGRYSLLEQPALPSFLPLAAERNIGVVLGGVFNSGILATGPIPGARYDYQPAPAAVLARVKEIERVCLFHGVPLRRAALHFALGHPAVTTVVLGAVHPVEVSSQITSFSAPVPAELWADLKSREMLDQNVVIEPVIS